MTTTRPNPQSRPAVRPLSQSSHPTNRVRGRWRRALGALAAGAAALLLATLPGAPAHADDDLTQTIDPNQAQGEGQTVLTEGHIDIGPTLGTGSLILEAHDDTGESSVWRKLPDVVVQVLDAGEVTVPDDSTYSFLGADAGQTVWIIPQTQKTGVAWLGWNTQEPQLMQTVSGGVTFSLVGVEGPGQATVFLQSGNFGAPQVLWSSANAFPQDTWLEVNTHTHANWAFTQKGIYLMRFRVTATTLSGEEISTEDTLRVAVGSDADTAAAFAAQWSGEDGAGAPAGASAESGQTGTAADAAVNPQAQASNPSSEGSPDSSTSGRSEMRTILIVGGALVLLALIGSIIAFVVSGRKTRRAVWEARSLIAREGTSAESSSIESVPGEDTTSKDDASKERSDD